ncbi:iron permease [Scheffersomyces xylosifermentans]|uniref:iron permease n=1 Tax=Scheffersomyces xylosifermentans TaxID=1304137 RepID=UPI00315D74E2
MVASFDDYFSIQAFLIVLRETLESAIIISVLLAFLHQSFKTSAPKSDKKVRRIPHEYNSIDEPLIQPSSSEGSTSTQQVIKSEDSIDTESVYKYLKLQIWIGGLLGLVVCLLFGSVILGVFYILGKDLWVVAEHYWEGTFSILASIIISVMGIKILRINKMQEKWKYKLSKLIQNSDYLNKAVRGHQGIPSKAHGFTSKFELWSEKYSMFILPFVTTLREGMEAIVFIGGIGINENTSIWALVNSIILAILIGSAIGVLLYRSGNTLSLQWFLITSTCFLYLVAAGLFSKGVWNFELQHFIDLCDGFDVSETGHGPGSYDIATSVWHVNCCNGELQDDGAFWMMFTAIFGWTNSATFGSVISYNLYWIVIIASFSSLLYEEKHGKLPIIPISWQQKRIQKRLNGYMPLSSAKGQVTDETRQSMDSVSSQTPLNG